ncbi:hypothetical protein BU17DRAFT_67474 [Hysterangium stoloniferum]|nr:hypothetical protein BU17DRAFT_67474 [Hysterangium stoloniferum]
MKYSSVLFSTILISVVASVPVKRNVDPNLVPDLGFTAGKNPTGTGDCDGAVNGADGKPIKIPCACPPDRATFLTAINRDIAAGHAVNNPSVKVSFPTDNSVASQQARITAASISLQNLHGPGQGCPIVSTTLRAQSKAIDAGTARPPAVAPAPAPPRVVSSAPAAGGFNPALVPDLGFTAGKNPTGTGDCDGAVNGANGKPIKVPCACPPDSQTFLKSVQADVAAGHAINNPTVKVSFPTDNSVASQLARINTASVSLQNLHGPGKGCPIVSTTLQAQAEAIHAGTAPPPPVAAPTPTPPACKVASSAPAADGFNPALVPDLGFTAGKNPTGTGDCDGAVNGANGKPIKVPCACPPDRQTFLRSVQADVAAGHAVNNPTVKVSFPIDNSVASQLERINTASVSLQNLHGPGKGCPIVSSTLQAQAAALRAKQ